MPQRSRARLSRRPAHVCRGRRDQGLVARRPLRATARRQHRRRRRHAQQDARRRSTATSASRSSSTKPTPRAMTTTRSTAESLRRRQGARHLRPRARVDGRLRRGGLRAEPRRPHYEESGAVWRHHRAAVAVGELQGRALRGAAGFRGPHVLPEQRQAPQVRQERQGHRRAARQGGRRRVHRKRLCDLAGQAVQKGVAKYGILHRPNAGPDFQMLMETFGLGARTTRRRPSCRHRRRRCGTSTPG